MKYILFGEFENSLQIHLSKFKDNPDSILLECVSSNNEIRSFSVIDEILNTSEDFDLIIINLDASLVNRQNKHGIDILKYIRFKCENDKKIISVSIREVSDWISEKATNSILIAPNNYYLQLPIERNKLVYALYGLEHLEYKDLKKAYFPFVYPDFNFNDFNHSFSNSYGFYIMEKFFKEFLDNDYKLKPNEGNKLLDFAKADFLFKHSVISKNQKIRLKNSYNYISNFDDQKQIVHIDDEGDQQWYTLFSEIFKKHKYVPLNNIVKADGNKILLNKPSIIERLKNIKAIDLILIDLRLLGQHEDKKPLEQLSGSNLIKAIRKEVDSAVPIILVSATDRLKSISLLQEYPYNVNYFWQKPRVDKGKINLAIVFNDLFEKVNKALLQYRLPVQKIMSRTEYDLKKWGDTFNSQQLNNSLSQYDYFIFDTNFFCETTESYSKYLLAYYKLFKILNSLNEKKIIIIRDVVSEIFLNSIKNGSNREELRIVSSFSLKILKEHLRTNTISNLHHQVERSADNALIKGIKENKFKNNWEVIYTTFKVEDSFEKEADANKFLELSKNKTVLHADTTFKNLIRHSIQNKNILFISDDKGCRYGIAKELGFGGEENRNDYSLQFKKNQESQEYINYSIPKGNIVIKKIDHIVTMVNNKRFCKMINS